MYIELLKKSTTIKNEKYLNWYIALCNKAISRQNGAYTSKAKSDLKSIYGYVEVHHILPRCMCENNEQINDSHNKIILTAKEHYIAHLLLAYATKSYKMMLALKIMAEDKNTNRYNSNLYSKYKNDILEAMSENSKRIIEQYGHPRQGVTLLEETKRKISKSLTNKKQSPETIKKRGDTIRERYTDGDMVHGNKGRTYSDEYKKKMSESVSKVIKTEEWNRKNSKANTGRIHIANTITKQRRRPKAEEAEKLIKESKGIWIKLATNVPIPDFE
jgi:hypothetical protein